MVLMLLTRATETRRYNGLPSFATPGRRGALGLTRAPSKQPGEPSQTFAEACGECRCPRRGRTSLAASTSTGHTSLPPLCSDADRALAFEDDDVVLRWQLVAHMTFGRFRGCKEQRGAE